MKAIIDFDDAEKQILQEVKGLILESRRLVNREPLNLTSGIDILCRLRKRIYEALNQIQHEGMILRAARMLQTEDFSEDEVQWYWNPRQTGSSDEPDLLGKIGSEVVLSAEITSSGRPIGSIDQRMAKTLNLLSGMQGKRIYFVSTESMLKRAQTKVERGSYQIEVRLV